MALSVPTTLAYDCLDSSRYYGPDFRTPMGWFPNLTIEFSGRCEMSATMERVHPQVGEFLEKTRPMLIDGKWVESASGKSFETPDPATGQVLARVTEGDRE